MFTAKHIKEGKMLIKGVTKFIHYKRDILSEEKLAAIREKQAAFQELLKTGTKEQVREEAKELQKVCERSLPMPTMPGLRENVEVFFVAIVIALGIRSYFLQPFKIPTGSMQPTLNGIIAYGYGDDKETEWNAVEPNILKKGWDLLWHGRNYVELRAEEDFIVTGVRQTNPLKFFSFTHIDRQGANGETLKPLKIWAPLDKAMNHPEPGHDGLGMGKALGFSAGETKSKVGLAQRSSPGTPSMQLGRGVKAGDLLARGYINTGDQVLVNKFSYHFRQPKRGEVFVFTTQDIQMIMAQNKQSQHYIKRLCAVPGDTFEVTPPEVYINGERATEPGMVRVMSQQDGYSGYASTGPPRPLSGPDDTGLWDGRRWSAPGRLGEKEYLAMGDNSPNSWDGRAWGPVPEKSLVGPALFVYWPFGAHWGLID